MSSPSKLFSCVDPDVILKSPLNSSVSKMHWSFSRSSRFPKQKPKQQIVYYASCDQLYQIPDNKQMRSTSFGYGKRSKVELEGTNREIPPSNRYHIDSFVEINKKRSCGVGLGKGRDEIESQGIYYRGNGKNNPGPGTYQTNRLKQVPSWSLGIKTMSQWDIKEVDKLLPGPGAYKEVPMNPEGRYSLSHYKNSLSTTWNPKRSRRFCDKSVDLPGPGSYDSQHDISSSGDYILSKNTSSGHRKMLLSKRQGFIDQIKKRLHTPGPGAYRIPSDFGIYDHLNDSCHHPTNRTHTSGFNHTRSQILEPKNN